MHANGHVETQHLRPDQIQMTAQRRPLGAADVGGIRAAGAEGAADRGGVSVSFTRGLLTMAHMSQWAQCFKASR